MKNLLGYSGNEQCFAFQNRKKNLHEVKDLLGRKTKIINNKVLFYIYDDGTVEKKFIVD